MSLFAKVLHGPCVTFLSSPNNSKIELSLLCALSFFFICIITILSRDDFVTVSPIKIFVAECGILPANLIPLVWGGNAPKITEFPWHASMYYDHGNEKKYFCGATLIQDNLLITAAHCVYDEITKRVVNPKKILIATGNLFRDYDSPLHDLRLIKKNKVCMYIHVLQL